MLLFGILTTFNLQNESERILITGLIDLLLGFNFQHMNVNLFLMKMRRIWSWVSLFYLLKFQVVGMKHEYNQRLIRRSDGMTPEKELPTTRRTEESRSI